MVSSKKAAPELRVILDGNRLEDEITVVDFNPTLYTIASESDYSSLTNAAGELYVEEMEKAMQPELVTVTKIEDDEEVAVADFDSSDFLLDTVVGIHELQSPDEIPAALQEYELDDYYTISILYVDDTGKYHYEDTCSYLVVATEQSYYLLEIGMYSLIEDTLQDGKISSNDNVFAYEINKDDYEKMNALFVKP